MSAEKIASIFHGADTSGPFPLPTHKHGDPIVPVQWAVRNRLPQTGAGLLVAQWGSYKTFVALDLSLHVMLGWAWTGEPVYRRGGVLVFAPEGAAGLGLRLAALVEHRLLPHQAEAPDVDPHRLPIEWSSSCPPLVGKDDPLPVMVATAKVAAERFRKEYNLPLALIWIDTMAASAGWKDENDNAEAARALAVLRELSNQTGAVVMGIDHAGKVAEAGTRGASAKEANSDFIFHILADKQLNGDTSNTRLALRKLRDGPQGGEIPFAARLVDMGPDERGYPLTSRVIDWNVKPQMPPGKLSESALAFEAALSETLHSKGTNIDVEGRAMLAARRDDVRLGFHARYKTGSEMKNSALDEGFRRALRQALTAGRASVTTIAAQEWIWRPEGPF